jgi:hypothetical protein
MIPSDRRDGSISGEWFDIWRGAHAPLLVPGDGFAAWK